MKKFVNREVEDVFADAMPVSAAANWRSRHLSFDPTLRERGPKARRRAGGGADSPAAAPGHEPLLRLRLAGRLDAAAPAAYHPPTPARWRPRPRRESAPAVLFIVKNYEGRRDEFRDATETRSSPRHCEEKEDVRGRELDIHDWAVAACTAQ